METVLRALVRLVVQRRRKVGIFHGESRAIGGCVVTPADTEPFSASSFR